MVIGRARGAIQRMSMNWEVRKTSSCSRGERPASRRARAGGSPREVSEGGEAGSPRMLSRLTTGRAAKAIGRVMSSIST
jgi:hypothetical protein